MKRLALSILFFVCALVPPAFSQESSRPSPSATVEETPSAMVRPHVVHKLPMKVKIAIAVTTLVGGAAALAFSARRWSSWNLFGRQYRFPVMPNASIRLGGKRSGGRMGTIKLEDHPNGPPQN